MPKVKCKHCNGGSCRYPDYCNGKSEDGYCKPSEGSMKVSKCNEYRKGKYVEGEY